MSVEIKLELWHFAAIRRSIENNERVMEEFLKGPNPYDAMFYEGDANSLREVEAYIRQQDKRIAELEAERREESPHLKYVRGLEKEAENYNDVRRFMFDAAANLIRTVLQWPLIEAEWSPPTTGDGV